MQNKLNYTIEDGIIKIKDCQLPIFIENCPQVMVHNVSQFLSIKDADQTQPEQVAIPKKSSQSFRKELTYLSKISSELSDSNITYEKDEFPVIKYTLISKKLICDELLKHSIIFQKPILPNNDSKNYCLMIPKEVYREFNNYFHSSQLAGDYDESEAEDYYFISHYDYDNINDTIPLKIYLIDSLDKLFSVYRSVFNKDEWLDKVITKRNLLDEKKMKELADYINTHSHFNNTSQKEKKFSDYMIRFDYDKLKSSPQAPCIGFDKFSQCEKLLILLRKFGSDKIFNEIILLNSRYSRKDGQFFGYRKDIPPTYLKRAKKYNFYLGLHQYEPLKFVEDLWEMIIS